MYDLWHCSPFFSLVDAALNLVALKLFAIFVMLSSTVVKSVAIAAKFVWALLNWEAGLTAAVKYWLADWHNRRIA